MALEVRRQEHETTQSLLRRFSRRIQQSGIMVRARQVRYSERPKSKGARKRAALRKQELKKEYGRLEKLGETRE